MPMRADINHHFSVRLSAWSGQSESKMEHVEEKRPISSPWMESSLKQFGVIFHQSRHIPPEPGIGGEKCGREKPAESERKGLEHSITFTVNNDVWHKSTQEFL